MKKVFLFLAVSVTAFLISCAPTKDEAIKHNDGIVADQKALLAMEDEIIDLITQYAEYDKVNAKYVDYTTFINSTLKRYEEMSAFDKKDVFRLAMVDFLTAFKGVSENQLKKLIDMYKIGFENFTEEDNTAFDGAAAEMDEIENKAITTFVAKQEEFSKDYGFTLY